MAKKEVFVTYSVVICAELPTGAPFGATPETILLVKFTFRVTFLSNCVATSARTVIVWGSGPASNHHDTGTTTPVYIKQGKKKCGRWGRLNLDLSPLPKKK